MTTSAHKRTRGFTLIELMMVLAIIGILMALVGNALWVMRKRADIARAATEAGELTKAWRAYWITYGAWPPGVPAGGSPEGVPMRGEIVKHLFPDGNPQGLLFLDLNVDAGVIKNQGLKDPWDNYYHVYFGAITTFDEIDWYETTIAMPNWKRYLYD
jgi:prepilin-type N-terminal cleavage/methylation domain-containing protein